MIPKQRQHPDVTPVPAETLAAAIAGDRHAFGEIYRTHHDEIYRYVYYRVASKSLAEDITAETFVRAIRNIGGFATIRSGMIGWLMTIARNLIKDHHKSSYSHREHVTADGEMRDGAELEAAPDDSVLRDITAKAVHDAVSRLNDQQRECITLRFLQGLSVAETADAMGKLEGAVKTLQYRATLTLARLIATDPRLTRELAA